MKTNKRIVVGEKYSRLAMGSTFMLGLGLVIASSMALASTSQQEAPSQSSQPKANAQYSSLPAGLGKDTLVRVCSKCHSPTNVIANGQNREGWEATITKMAGLGATGSDEDFTEILDYVAKNFPPATKVNMNKATAAEIESQLGFSTQQAEDIVAYREKNGTFKTSEDLKKVPKLEAKEVDVRRNRMLFQ